MNATPNIRQYGTGFFLGALLLVDAGILSAGMAVILKDIDRRVTLSYNYSSAPGCLPCRYFGASSRGRAPRPAAGPAPAELSWRVFSQYGGSCRARSDDDGVQLAYDVSSPSAECRYEAAMPPGGGQQLVFDIRSDAGDEVFQVRYGDNESRANTAITQVFPSRIPAEWRTVTLPLSRHAAGGTSDKRLAFVFSFSQGMPYRGTIHIRNVRLQ